MAGFVQIIEFETSRIDEVRALAAEFRDEQDGARNGMVVRGTFGSDRDRPGHHVNIVEFESYEKAMENSNRPETSKFAARLAELCDSPPKFTNLDVEERWE
ncbi:MAG: hypothetical protein WCB04_05705 [Mycobacteriales bacterium]